MLNFIKQLKINFWLSSVISVLLGLFFIIWPTQVQGIIAVVLGIVLLVLGIVWVVTFIKAPAWTFGNAFLLFSGAVFIAVGIWMIVNPLFFNKIIMSIIGILVAINGVMAMGQAFSLKSVKYNKWWLSLIFAVATIILAILVICYPIVFGDLAVQIVGGILIYNGVSDIWIATRVHKHVKKIKASNDVIDVEYTEETVSDIED